MSNYQQEYDSFWRELVENPDGTLNKDQVMRELSDYSGVMREVAVAYDSVTGKFSKPNTAAHHVIDAVNERIDAACRAALDDVATLLDNEGMAEGARIARSQREDYGGASIGNS